MLTEYDDRKALFSSLRLILAFVVMSGLITIMFTMSTSLETIRQVRYISEFLNIPVSWGCLAIPYHSLA